MLVPPETLARADPAAGPQAPPPAVLPALKQWTPEAGEFQFGSHSRIVLDTGDARALGADADGLAGDIAEITGLRPRVVRRGTARDGEIKLSLAGGRPTESYRLTIGDHIAITGGSATGAFYGAQTLEQMLTAGRSLPRGTALDAPGFAHRGLMIDGGRKYWSIDYLKQTIRQMAWHKLNTLHWHLTDAEAFRIAGFPGVSAPRSYTRAEIREIQDHARRYHVRVVPEIDLPGHATAITRGHPRLRWPCESMNAILSLGRYDPGFTFDITEPANVALVDRMLDEIIPLFDSPVVHLGTDETPDLRMMNACPRFLEYVKEHGYRGPGDVFVDYFDHLNGLVRRHGKRMAIWGYWPIAGGNTKDPAKDILVEAWRGNERYFLDRGYEVIVSRGQQQYVVPGRPPGWLRQPDDQAQYETFSYDPRLRGYEMAVWTDRAFQISTDYFDWFIRRPLEVLADRTWGGPAETAQITRPAGTRAGPIVKFSSAGTGLTRVRVPAAPRTGATSQSQRAAGGGVFAFQRRADRIGPAPGVPARGDPAASPLTGIPYGSVNDPAAAFDGNPATFADDLNPDGGHVGLDLGGARRLSAIRFVPTRTSGRMTGGRFQGCAEGPAAGCRDIATVPWRPPYTTVQVPITDPGAYRWVRYVGPPGGHTNVAEIEFQAAGPIGIAGPATLSSHSRAEVTVRNDGDRTLRRLRVSLSGIGTAGFNELSGGSTRIDLLRAHTVRRVSLPIRVPHGAPGGSYRLTAHVVGDRLNARGFAATSLPGAPLPSGSPVLEHADNIGVTDDGNIRPGDIDGAQSSMSAQALAAAGIEPGGTVSAAGLRFTWPATAGSGDPDNTLAHGQTLSVTGRGTKLGLLVTGTYDPPPATGLIRYADGTSQPFTVSVPDWRAAAPAGAAVTTRYTNRAGDKPAAGGASLYVATAALDPARRVTAVTLPDVGRYVGDKAPALHVFSVAIGP